LYNTLVFSEMDILAAINLIGSVGFTFVGIALGVCIIEFVVNLNITYDTFDRIGRYRMPFGWYLFYIAALSTTLLVILYYQLIQVGVGPLLLNDVQTDPKIGFIVGILCGIAEPHVVSLVTLVFKPVQKKESG
jgi:hypothetical protein